MKNNGSSSFSPLFLSSSLRSALRSAGKKARKRKERIRRLLSENTLQTHVKQLLRETGYVGRVQSVMQAGIRGGSHRWEQITIGKCINIILLGDNKPALIC